MKPNPYYKAKTKYNSEALNDCGLGKKCCNFSSRNHFITNHYENKIIQKSYIHLLSLLLGVMLLTLFISAYYRLSDSVTLCWLTVNIVIFVTGYKKYFAH